MRRSINSRLCYFINLTSRIARKQGHTTALVAGFKFLFDETIGLSRAIHYSFNSLKSRKRPGAHPEIYPEELMQEFANFPIERKIYGIDANAFRQHIANGMYPSCYAGGPVEKGGAREKKLLEYFISLDLLNIHSEDVVIDVGSEFSIFPEVLQRITGATVYRQDLIYPPGVNDHYIGGSAANMHVPAEFADQLVLHNTFEHFEGTADTDFIMEAFRVLRPGGLLCILPLFITDRYCILTDPLINRNGVTWDGGAEVVEIPWWHNRFGRFYDPKSFKERVLEPALSYGFQPVLYHIKNITEVVPKSRLHFAFVLRKQA